MKSRLMDDLRDVINRNSRENDSNTPDMILADYLENCLIAFEVAVEKRDKWYGIAPTPGDPFARRTKK